jgi:hypothetical protein
MYGELSVRHGSRGTRIGLSKGFINPTYCELHLTVRSLSRQFLKLRSPAAERLLSLARLSRQFLKLRSPAAPRLQRLNHNAETQS